MIWIWICVWGNIILLLFVIIIWCLGVFQIWDSILMLDYMKVFAIAVSWFLIFIFAIKLWCIWMLIVMLWLITLLRVRCLLYSCLLFTYFFLRFFLIVVFVCLIFLSLRISLLWCLWLCGGDIFVLLFLFFGFGEEIDGNLSEFLEKYRIEWIIFIFFIICFFHSLCFLCGSLIIFGLFSIHQQNINNPIPLPACPPHPLNHSNCWHTSLITKYSVNLSYIQTLLSYWSWNQRINLVCFISFD